jgi:molecular chaperone HtpG
MSGLNSKAEQLATEATKLQAFNNMNLIGVKEQLAELLGMIGSVQGIFSTYTKHDISHIDAMLEMLDWMIPPSTVAAMTPTDWLLIVLSIYLHDLGMFVPSAEYDSRDENQAFQQFLDRLDKDPNAKDYLSRANDMEENEKDRFFYQEFIRSHHASRIREWVTGRLSRHWPAPVQSVGQEIAKILEDLPTRFREHLALVCESHHKEDLHKTDTYPLYQKYGKSRFESANVQYAAFILRTADLVHVTKDRTPSIMYRTINFSDLKSVNEWDKQRGTSSVHMKSRDFDPANTESHIIVVSADFNEERPFFALAEYLAWADREIKQTKRWADISQQSTDGKDFFFPWQGIQGDILVEGNSPRQMRFELDRGRLLDLLVGHTIYNDPTVALRELLQNSIDAVRYQYYQDKKQSRISSGAGPEMGKVIVKWNPASRELVVEDNGIGMDLDIIQSHLLRVGSSFYSTPQFDTENEDFSPISRFGIGILTCFMVSDNIEIVTYRGEEGRRIRMTAVQAEYLLKELQSGDPQLEGLEPHGTRVRLILRPTVNLAKNSILDILRYWIILPACDVIYLEFEQEQKKIGFENLNDAIRYLYRQPDSEPGRSEQIYEAISVSPISSDGESYQLSFLVWKDMVSTQTLLMRNEGRASAVCVEGIRVDRALPGFTPELPCLLSVRNNRKFRTTVSRSNLEHDEEYFKVSDICTKALFNFIRSEVERIAAQPGEPLLQASSAGRLAGRSIFQMIRAAETRRTAQHLYNNLPLVVVEESNQETNSVKGTRSLKSINEVEQLSQFWTIESRTVDYLATISRDIGRELSITEFLGSLAPELQDPRLKTVVAEAHLFSGYLLNSHYVESAEFSRKHQRTLLRWEKRIYQTGILSFSQGIWRLVINIFNQLGLQINRYGAGNSIDEASAAYSYLQSTIVVAEVSGDLPQVTRVITRILTVLSNNSEAGKLWQELLGSIIILSSKNESRDLATLLVAQYILGKICSMKRSDREFEAFEETPRSLNNFWVLLLSDVNSVIEKHHFTFSIPDDLWNFMGDNKTIFDASTYWKDWDEY